MTEEAQFTEEEIAAAIPQLPDWQRYDNAAVLYTRGPVSAVVLAAFAELASAISNSTDGGASVATEYGQLAARVAKPAADVREWALRHLRQQAEKATADKHILACENAERAAAVADAERLLRPAAT